MPIPCPAKEWAIERPSPLDEPVTSATFVDGEFGPRTGHSEEVEKRLVLVVLVKVGEFFFGIVRGREIERNGVNDDTSDKSVRMISSDAVTLRVVEESEG